MFRFANEKDRDKLYLLWHECFGDGEGYVYPFLDAFLKEDNVYIFEDESKIASAVYSLPCKIGDKKGEYFYAVATDENYRKRGLAKAEIEFLIDYKQKSGSEIFILTASSEKNRKYYSKLGFRDAFFARKVKIKAEENNVKITENFSRSKLYELREILSKANNSVSFPNEHFSFALDFSERVFVEENTSYALVDGDKIVEAVSKKDTQKFVSRVLFEMGKKEAELYFPAANREETSCCNISRGMVYCSNKENLEKECEKVFLSLNLE